MVKKKSTSKSKNISKPKNKVLNFVGVTLLCGLGTAILTVIMMDNAGMEFSTANTTVFGLDAGFLGIFFVLLIVCFLYLGRRRK